MKQNEKDLLMLKHLLSQFFVLMGENYDEKFKNMRILMDNPLVITPGMEDIHPRELGDFIGELIKTAPGHMSERGHKIRDDIRSLSKFKGTLNLDANAEFYTNANLQCFNNIIQLLA